MQHKMGPYLHRMHELDSLLCLRVNRTSQYRWVRLPFRIISRLGDGVFWYTLMLGILLSQGESGLMPCISMLPAPFTVWRGYRVYRRAAFSAVISFVLKTLTLLVCYTSALTIFFAGHDEKPIQR